MRTSLLTILAACAPTAELTDVAAPDEPIRFALPLADPTVFNEVIGFDHDPEEHTGALGAIQCTSYDGEPFPACYDGHDGTDYILEGGFDAMDAGSVEVLAAAAGVVVSIEDSQYDRCHLAGVEVSCDGHPMVGNHVKIDHGGGLETWYWHLMQDSVGVEVGDEVLCGDALGLVGSSGLSSFPHLHFEVRLDGATVDPYAGEESQSESYWVEQGPPDGLPEASCATD